MLHVHQRHHALVTDCLQPLARHVANPNAKTKERIGLQPIIAPMKRFAGVNVAVTPTALQDHFVVVVRVKPKRKSDQSPEHKVFAPDTKNRVLGDPMYIPSNAKAGYRVGDVARSVKGMVIAPVAKYAEKRMAIKPVSA